MRKLLIAALGVAAAVSSVHGQISYNDVTDFVFTPADNDLFLDFDTGDFTFDSSSPGTDAGFGFAFHLPELLFFTDDSVEWSLATSAGAARRFSFGDALDFSETTGGWRQADNDANTSTWSGSLAGQTYYMALRNATDSLDAWVAMEYDDLGNKLTIQSFAIAPISQSMTAGQTAVPEPAETAAVIGLMAAGAAIWQKRRKKAAA